MKDMLRACVLEFKDSWVDHLSLVEFGYNNNYQASIGMALYEALFGRKCKTPLDDVELIEITSKKIRIIRDRLKVVQDRQKSYADTWRRELEFKVGDMVFLKVAYWKRVI